MTYEYSAENHDWDLTFRAAWSLVMMSQAVDFIPTGGSKPEREFSCVVGSMILSFCAVESFCASLAFCLPSSGRYPDFDFESFKREKRFWPKIERICSSLNIKVDKSQGLFQRLAEMQEWRNLVTHAFPYRIEKTFIQNTTNEPSRLNSPYRRKQYTQKVKISDAQKFYETAYDFIDLLKKTSGITPRAQVTYRNIG